MQHRIDKIGRPAALRHREILSALSLDDAVAVRTPTRDVLAPLGIIRRPMRGR